MSQGVSVDEIADLVRNANHIRGEGEAAFVHFLNSHSLQITAPSCSPHSAEYRDFWAQAHRKILGESYDPHRHENYKFDLSQLIKDPYPYATRDPSIIAKQIRDWANVLEALDAPPGSSVLEMGAGWGNTSLLLAQSGFEVSVLDINPAYLELIEARSRRLKLQIDTFEAEFLDVTKINERYDIILFYESFHHSIEHARLLTLLKERLNNSGKICFAGEPIIDGAPYAWGLNPAGEALYQIHTHGWMELIFDKKYFDELLKSQGFLVRWVEFSQGTSIAIADL